MYHPITIVGLLFTQNALLVSLGINWDSLQFWSFQALFIASRFVSLDQGFYRSLEFFINLSDADQALLRSTRDKKDD